eukprot:CAMPEP_0118921980 /NCGR_PEP_ID=MMETSP1169-20130426/1074_1 /TAXON_ID=36882 /ORGANISM="Pyramimonas obovata, Strain CCMP722" /LENGTH=339 /DNA_ID=CAMNT_0006862787 /DNA_START=149 /DNA_END=1165 /DNA_ORIENTATION=-
MTQKGHCFRGLLTSACIILNVVAVGSYLLSIFSTKAALPVPAPRSPEQIIQSGCAYAGTLESLARKYKPTKFFPYLHTGYHRFYETFFEQYRSRPLRMLEIGLDSGAGTLMWKEYFPCVELFGIDSNTNTSGSMKAKTVARVFQGDQSNATFLKEFVKQSGGNFDIIVDDGGHSFLQQIVSYQVLFETALRPGGIYAIEDIESSFWDGGRMYGVKMLGGLDNPSTTYSKFKKVADVVNRKFHDNRYQVFGRVDLWVKGITFYPNLIILQKKSKVDRPYDAHYIYNKQVKGPAKYQGNEFSYGPSPFAPDTLDPNWKAARLAPNNFQAKYGPKAVPVFVW